MRAELSQKGLRILDFLKHVEPSDPPGSSGSTALRQFYGPSARAPAAGAPLAAEASLTSPGGHPQRTGCSGSRKLWCHLFFGFLKPHV